MKDTTKHKIKTELEALVLEGAEVAQCLVDEKPKSDFYSGYQMWYTKALRVVELLAKDRYSEFRGYYEPDPKRKSLGYGTYVIQDFHKGVVPSRLNFPDFDAGKKTYGNMANQIHILQSLTNRIDNVLMNVESTLFADIQEAELKTSTSLLKVSARAAGALADVVLETHLLKVCESHSITVTKKTPTISDLNDLLKNSNIFDTPAWRKVSYLGDLRNKCSHKRTTDPTEEEVTELIEGVNWAIKNYT